MAEEFKFTNDGKSKPEEVLIQLCFYFSLLIEYQLNDLQANVRDFVQDMSNAIQEMDNLVVAEGHSAQELFESLFNQGQEINPEESSDASKEASRINARANKRANEIFSEAINNLHPGQSPAATFNCDPNLPHQEEASSTTKEKSSEETSTQGGATDKIWSDIAKRFESFCRMEERLRPQVYTMIQSLNFEDIQTQRIEHALMAQKKLNEGIMQFLSKGIHNCTTDEVVNFANELMIKTMASYTMMDERHVFNQVFITPIKKGN